MLLFVLISTFVPIADLKKQSHSICSHTGHVTSVVFSPSDRKHITSGSMDRTICIWDVKRRKLAVGPLTEHEESVNAIAYSRDGTRLVSGHLYDTVRI